MNKFLYFRTVANEANDGVTGLKTSAPSSFMFPADTLTAMQPTSDTALTLYFSSALNNNNAVGGLRDTVVLNVSQGDIFEVMSAITDAIANPARGHSDGFIVIADDVATTDSAVTALNDLAVSPRYAHGSITSCGAITVQPSSNGMGVHEYFETVDLSLDVADNAVAGNLSIYIPAQAHITYAAITPVELAGNDIGSIALEVHSAHDTGASGGTEIVGADVAGNVSLPDADLDISSNALVGKSITMGTLAEIQRSTAASYFALVGKADMTSTPMTGTPKVAVYLKWFGPAAVAR
tara:strand:+ start:86 stop:967 length:882 start_codon:yes stop_codon:yes gene_type:complete